MKVESCLTPNFHGYNVKFSPSLPELLACAASENYGIAGKGALFIITEGQEEGYHPALRYDWRDGLFNLSWSNHSSNFIATSSGDGSLQVWSTFDNKLPPSVFRGHTREVYGLDWSPRLYHELILSGSADESVKVWDANTGVMCESFERHEGVVYSVAWCPHTLGVFASVGADGNLMLWDTRVPQLLPQMITAHADDVLTCDWNVLNPCVVATGGIDSQVNIWDLRSTELPVSTLVGHELAVRRVKFSPFHRNVLTSVSYDCTTRFWDLFTSVPCETYKHHTEFVCGLDFSLHFFDRMADCGWDSKVRIYKEIDYGFCI